MIANVHRIAAGLRKHKRFAEVVDCIRQTQQWPQLIPAYLAQSRLDYPFEFSTRDQSKVLLETWDDLTTVWHVFFANEYHVPREARTIVDLGANIGAFAIWAADRCPSSRILSFEPFPATFERLRDNVGANGLESRVDCVRMAVGGHDGVSRFESAPDKRSYCRKLVADSSIGETIDVECMTLASLFERFGLKEIDCLKMDVEGAEYEIILSASPKTLRRAKVITLEYHDAERSSVLWEKLSESGFRRVLYAPGGWSGVAAYERVG